MGETLEDGWVGVFEDDFEWVRMEIAEVVDSEFFEGGDKDLGFAKSGDGKCVGLEFVAAGEPVGSDAY